MGLVPQAFSADSDPPARPNMRAAVRPLPRCPVAAPARRLAAGQAYVQRPAVRARASFGEAGTRQEASRLVAMGEGSGTLWELDVFSDLFYDGREPGV